MRGELSKLARAELLGKIGDRGVIAAFDLLVSGMTALQKFELSPNILGHKKSLHFKTGRVSYFAFIANKSWLLWYFRRPGVRDGVFDFYNLQLIFPELEFSSRSDPEKTEAVIKVRDVEITARILEFVEASRIRQS